MKKSKQINGKLLIKEYKPDLVYRHRLNLDMLPSIRRHRVISPIEVFERDGVDAKNIWYFLDYYFLAWNLKKMSKWLLLRNEKMTMDSFQSMNIIWITQLCWLKFAQQIWEKIIFFLANKFPYAKKLPDTFRSYYKKYLKKYYSDSPSPLQ